MANIEQTRNLNLKKTIAETTMILTVKLNHRNEMAIRAWIGAKILKLAAFVIGVKTIVLDWER